MKKLKFFSLLAMFAAIFSFTSCNTSEGPQGEYQAGVFANYEGIEGMNMRFSYTAPNSDEPINIIAQATGLSDAMTVMPGTRVYLIVNVQYGQEVVNNSVVGFYGLAKLNTYGDVESGAAPANWFDCQDIYITTMTRAGNYLDIMAMAPEKGTSLRLVADETTIDSENPVMYLIYENSTTGSSNINYVASFDIESVISRPNCKKITVMVHNSNGLSSIQYTIRK